MYIEHSIIQFNKSGKSSYLPDVFFMTLHTSWPSVFIADTNTCKATTLHSEEVFSCILLSICHSEKCCK
jgi:hypothetical protein